MVAVAAVACIRVGLEQFIEYDGWWHVFVSRAETLQTFHEDWHKTAHPPLYFLLLKMFSFLGTSWLAYRAVGIAAAIVAVFLVGKIAERITSSRILGVIAAAGFGLSTATVIVAGEVRAYMLAIAFVLLAFDAYLAGRKWLFCAALTAALMTLYATVFFFAAMFLVAIAQRRWKFWPAFVPPALFLAAAYQHHIYQWVRLTNHLPEFRFDPGDDTVAGFLLEGFRKEFNLFSSFAVPEAFALPLAIVLLAAAVVALMVTLRARDVTVAVLLLLVAQTVLAAFLGKYPFGGELRQQYLIFPFVVLGLVSVASAWRRRAAIVILALLFAANVAAGYVQFRIAPQPLFANEIAKFRATVSSPAMLYLDEFSTMAFFSHHDEWDWHLAGADSTHTLLYDLTREGRSMQLVRVRNVWMFKAFDQALYRDLRRTMDLHRAQTAGLFGLATIPDGVRPEEARARVARAAASERLTVESITVDGRNLYARLSATP